VIYDQCSIGTHETPENFDLRMNQLFNIFLERKSPELITKFRKDAEQNDFYVASKNLSDELARVLRSSYSIKADFGTLDASKEWYLEEVERVRKNPDEIISCHIPEIDDVMNVGFKSQGLTLFVGDVASGKTTIMLNVALNIYDQHNTSVLFIPLEMGKKDIIDRIVSNRIGIPFTRLARPEMLTEEEMEKIKNAKIWESMKHKFAILDAADRMNISVLERELERRVFIFNPKVVVIDYIANLEPDKGSNFGARHDLTIGEILKNLRFMGKKYGFHVISAAQMGRAAITKLRQDPNSTPDSTSIRGSHEYSADSDNVFAIVKVPGEEDHIKLHTIKARFGPSGQTQDLRVQPIYCRVSSCSNASILSEGEDLSDFDDMTATDPDDTNDAFDFLGDDDF